jgi:hypothetical protein
MELEWENGVLNFEVLVLRRSVPGEFWIEEWLNSSKCVDWIVMHVRVHEGKKLDGSFIKS